MIYLQPFGLNPSENLQANTFAPSRGILKLITVEAAPPLNIKTQNDALCRLHYTGGTNDVGGTVELCSVCFQTDCGRPWSARRACRYVTLSRFNDNVSEGLGLNMRDSAPLGSLIKNKAIGLCGPSD